MSNLRFIPLGGVGEIGKNMYVYEVDNELLVVDAGLMFPDEKQFGVDIIVPDIRYLVENRDRIQGNQDRDRDERNMADTEYLTREIASIRNDISQVTTREYLHSEIRDAIEEIVKKLNKKS